MLPIINITLQGGLAMRLINLIYTFLLLNALIGLYACSSKKKEAANQSTPQFRAANQDSDILEMSYAAKRKEMVSEVKYRLKFEIPDTGDEFTGTAIVQFMYKKSDVPLTLDFNHGEISLLDINGISLTRPLYNQAYLILDDTYLREGLNKVIINYKKHYTKNGSGFYQFTDPKDNLRYYYTDFEPYHAHHLFPCFDQPDLKATYSLQVTAPANFKVITAGKVLQKLERKNQTIWLFRETLPFSTYIFSLHAGPYKEFKDQYKSIPLRLYARQTLADHVHPEFWFKITKQGLAFFEDYFDFDYPFLKYDQVIVPDFNSGAMENVGAVTFSENYIRRGKKTKEEEERLANVILHEMSHMWFGDIVTMDWWNGLWLNESFASFMATKALFKATEFKKSWMSFYNSDKNWAYEEDEMSTTHPIESTVNNTDEAFNNFDGITYGKGASVLKQLEFFIGEKNFRRGVQTYFKTYAYQNTKLDNFLAELSSASGKNLNEWADLWLKTTGVDSAKANFECEKGKIKNFFVEDDGKDGRYHAMNVGFFYRSKNKLELKKELPITYQIKTELEDAKNLNCPDLVILNVGDYDYVKTQFDNKSLNTIKSDLALVNDSLTRSQIWGSLWSMVRDAKFSPADFLEIIPLQLAHEKDLKLKQKVFKKFTQVLYYLAEEHGVAAEKLETFLLGQLKKTSNLDEKKIIIDTYLNVANSTHSQSEMLLWLKSKDKIFDQDRRWAIIGSLASIGYKEAKSLIEQELRKDNSEKGKKASLRAYAAIPSKANKEEWFTKVMANDSTDKSALSLAEKKAVMQGLFPYGQSRLKRDFTHHFYGAIPKMVKTDDNELIETFSETLDPVTCTPYENKILGEYLIKNVGIHPVLVKSLKQALDEDTRCLKIRQI